MSSSTYDITDLAALQTLVSQLAKNITPGTVIALVGELGSGKTTFTKHLLEEIGVNDIVTSPTFTIVNQYQSPIATVFHLDLYRLKDATQLREIGFDELLDAKNVLIIEWPELVTAQLPQKTWWIHFELDENQQRTLTINKGIA